MQPLEGLKAYSFNLIGSLSGILLFTLGIMGIYIARIFEQARGRDKYIIKNLIGINVQIFTVPFSQEEFKRNYIDSGVKSVSNYVVKKGDTLSHIAVNTLKLISH